VLISEAATNAWSAGVEQLRASRDGKGAWRKHPFWYTVLALSEMEFKAAANELRYCEPVLRAAAARVARSGVHAARRHQLAIDALDQAQSRRASRRGPSAEDRR